MRNVACVATLTVDERGQFAEKGWLLLGDAVTAEQLVGLRADMASWVEESRDHQAPYGTSIDGRPRFTPHTNCDLVTALLFVDDVTVENGPLEVQDGSHRGPLHGLWHDGVFTGAVDQAVEDEARRSAVVLTGQAGTACLMHTRLMHGSTPNNSPDPAEERATK